MRTRSWITLIIVVLMVAVGVTAAWSLRGPLGRLGRAALDQAKPSSAVTFAVVGDNHGDNPIYHHILSALQSQHLAFMLNLADASNFGTREEFEAVNQAEQELPFPVYHTVGNHDIKADDTRQLFTSVFKQPAWQSVDYGPLHLVILDNADRQVGFPSASLTWLEGDLADHQHQTIIVAYHRPFDLPLSALLGDDETTASRKSNDRLRTLLERYHVRYILTAHLHTYLAYSVGDIPAVVSGGGGGQAQDILGGPSHNFFHYLIVTVRGTHVDVVVHRVDETASRSE